MHVELAIPHARRILAFCDFGLIDFWGLKFVFWRKKTDPRPLNAESPPAAKILGPAPWTYPRTFRPSDCFLFLSWGSLCRVLHLIYTHSLLGSDGQTKLDAKTSNARR